jgi:hypothetical protein
VSKENVINRARDELFSHINRCGVLQAEENDQQHWMEETIDYLAERYPDLSDADLQDLFSVGIRFCQPAIPHGRKRFGFDPREKASEPQAPAAPQAEPQVATEAAPEELIPQEAGGENTLQES